MNKNNPNTQTRVAIELNPDAQDALAGFPFRNGQTVVEEYEAEDGRETIFVDIDLADRTDTDAAQEQFLNTNPQVVGYSIR